MLAGTHCHAAATVATHTEDPVFSFLCVCLLGDCIPGGRVTRRHPKWQPSRLREETASYVVAHARLSWHNPTQTAENAQDAMFPGMFGASMFCGVLPMKPKLGAKYAPRVQEAGQHMRVLLARVDDWLWHSLALKATPAIEV